MSENKWLSVSEVTEITGVPVETVRRYIRSHGVHMKVKKIHKRYSIHSDSLDVIRQIRDLYSNGSNSEQIEQTLTNRGIAMTVTVETDDDKPMTVNVGDELKRMKELLEEQQKFSKQQTEFNKMLLERLDDRDRYIKETLERQNQLLDKRDHTLMEEVTKRLEAQKEVAATEDKESEKKSFFTRLFWKK